MLKNYFLTAIRQFWKNKSFSFINIFGLALSMAVCLLLIILIKDAHEYDRFHPGGERIFRINTHALRKGGGMEPYATSPYMVGATLASDFSGIESQTILYLGQHQDISVGDRKFSEKTFFSNDDFFHLFGFSLRDGPSNNVLREPNTAVLTAELNDKLVPGRDALGNSIEINGLGLFKVTGVLNPFPGKTHLEFDALLSFSSVPRLEKAGKILPGKDDWKNYYFNYTYIRLKPGVKSSQAEASLAEIEKSNYKNLVLEARDAGYQFRLQSLSSITPGPNLSNNLGKALSSGILWFFSMLSTIIILSAAFNYTNLTMAKAMSRMKEIAMRKVVGSNRKHIFFQILLESVLTSMLALAVALFILQILIPPFAKLSFIRSANINFSLDPSLILYFLLFAILLGAIAGVLPASVLSRIKPLALIQKLQNFKLFRHLGLRRTLLVIQFMISMIFISLVTIFYKQTAYSININFGTHQTNIFNLALQGQPYDRVFNEFNRLPGVEKISAVSHLMGNYSDMGDEVRISRSKDPIIVREYFVDENYLSNFNLQLIAGKGFPPNHVQKHEQFAIVNEKFLKHFNLGDPSGAVGKTIIVADSIELSILGVLKDFLFKPADYALEPMMLRYNPANWSFLNLSIASESTMQTTAALEAAWKKLDPNHPMDGRFYKEEIQSVFSDNREIIWMISFVGLLGITIACLGLLGITTFTIQSKTKEISIRKVVGASPLALIRLLTKSYVQVMVIAILISVPIAALLGYKLLQELSQRIPLSAGLFIPGILAIILLSFMTIGSQTIRAAWMNPVKGLRDE
ncbi:MAG: ABC transporter permease [Chitinophagales bacterium]